MRHSRNPERQQGAQRSRSGVMDYGMEKKKRDKGGVNTSLGKQGRFLEVEGIPLFKLIGLGAPVGYRF